MTKKEKIINKLDMAHICVEEVAKQLENDYLLLNEDLLTDYDVIRLLRMINKQIEKIGQLIDSTLAKGE